MNSTEGKDPSTSVTFKRLKIASIMCMENVSLGVHLTWAQIQALPLRASHLSSSTLSFSSCKLDSVIISFSQNFCLFVLQLQPSKKNFFSWGIAALQLC